jgi:hypothetical protein
MFIKTKVQGRAGSLWRRPHALFFYLLIGLLTATNSK